MTPDDLQSALARTAPTADPEAAAAATRRAAEQAAGAGAADVAYAIEPSPLGDLLVAVTPRGLVSLRASVRMRDWSVPMSCSEESASPARWISCVSSMRRRSSRSVSARRSRS